MGKILRLIYKLFRSSESLSECCRNYKVISFDIFDTLIVRQCGNPLNVFNIVQDLYSEETGIIISDFYQNRIEAERMARLVKGKEEVTIDDIYRFLVRNYGRKNCERLKNLEISVEVEQCVAVPEIVDIYNSCIENEGKNVFIVSDMYLPMDSIKQILNKNGIKQPCKIYLSCKEQVTKRKGGLFKLLMKENHGVAKEILHIGDNFKSDFLMAHLLGMHAFLVEKQ